MFLSICPGHRYASSAGHASQILGTMLKGQHDTWTGWVDMKPIAQKGAEDIIGDADNGGVGCVAGRTRLQLGLHFAPMDRWISLNMGLVIMYVCWGGGGGVWLAPSMCFS